MESPEVEEVLSGVDGVAEVHDLHLWTLTSGMNVATAHLVARSGAEPGTILASAQTALRDRFDVEHATLQVEPGTRTCSEMSW